MCGIVGLHNDPDATRDALLALYALQHRGQEAAGIVAAFKGRLDARHGLGLVADALGDTLSSLQGTSALGHVRYATAGDRSLRNAQPLVFDNVHGPVAIAHNGTLTNALLLRRALEAKGAIFRTSTDSEVIVHLLARRPGPLSKAVPEALRKVHGAYSLLFLTPKKMIAVRDPYGFRPLVLGRRGKTWIAASETSALNLLGARFVREVEPGEMVVFEKGRMRSEKPFPEQKRRAHCVFELIYFARPDSSLFGLGVQSTRRTLGRELAKEMFGVEADVVIPVPDSGVPAALGFADESGIPFELGFMRSHYVGRTFIQPGQGARDHAVRLKLAPVREALQGKRVVLVDDSLVRGTTSRRICSMLRELGVKSLHLALSSPPIISPCYYGIDTPERRELIAAVRSKESIRRYLDVDSVTWLSREGLLRVVHRDEGPTAADFCTACFTRDYPTPIHDFNAPTRN
ncbi:MAG: amidophosphoribosyltransferase [Elusimicrobiota bacterium]|jgi:amidophosphoribosyltransferase